MRTPYARISHPSRRRLLKVLSLTGFGGPLPLLFGDGPSTMPSRIRSCIVVFYYGGPSHLDTWDPKPHAPAEVRGEFRPIATSAPGIRISEHLPMMSRVMDRVAIVRTVHHPMRNHNSAAAEALTGRTPPGGDVDVLGDDSASYPCYGSALSYVLQNESCELGHVALPHTMHNVVVLPGQSAGFLGPAFERFQIEKDPNAADFSVSSLTLPTDMNAHRLNQRESLMRFLDGGGPSARSSIKASMHAYYDKAFGLLRSENVRRSLDISQERPAVRERYGRNKHGQSVLLARRLVEAGVRYITVFNGQYNGQLANWDSHQNNFSRHKDVLMPPADRALSALIGDLDERGLLESTLVIGMGEFGRTPRINGNAGRDHWPDCYSIVMAGGGVKGGTAYGASDRIGAYPDVQPVSTGDLAATLYWRFGIHPQREIHDSTGRPHRLAEGKPLHSLFI